jgi:hypothetical protein
MTATAGQAVNGVVAAGVVPAPVRGASPVASPVVVSPERARVGDLEMPTVWGSLSGSGAATLPVARRAGAGLDVEVAALNGEEQGPDLEEDGVLPPAGRDLAVLVGVVGTAAVAEAGWNVGTACLDLLHLPRPLAVMFPLVLESAAASCALQDLRDRRRGVKNRVMAAGTYLGLAVSAGVNGAVGYAAHGGAGLLEILPPVVLGALIHIHGSRSERAWKSRAKTRRGWRRAQLEAARIESVSEVLPLLTGDDEDGRATVALLRRRLDSGTLTPAEALIAAGWFQRHTRPDMTASRIRRLETVAATVWPGGAPPAPQRTTGASRAGATIASRGSASDRAASDRAASDRAASDRAASDRAASDRAASDRAASDRAASDRAASDRAASVDGLAGASGVSGGDPEPVESRTATDEEIFAAISQVWSVQPRAGERPIGRHLREQGLTASSARIRPLLERARAEVSASVGPGSSGEGLLPSAGPAEPAGAGGDDA